MSARRKVEFFNIDLIVAGRFDRYPLLRAAGGGVFALREDTETDGKKTVIFEICAARFDLARTLRHLLSWVQHLPPAAKKSWNAASRRIFDVGIGAGLEPHVTSWTIDRKLVAAMGKVGAELAVTIYGAEEGQAKQRPPARRSATRRVRRK